MARKASRYFARLTPGYGTVWQVMDRESFVPKGDDADFRSVWNGGVRSRREAKRKAKELNARHRYQARMGFDGYAYLWCVVDTKTDRIKWKHDPWDHASAEAKARELNGESNDGSDRKSEADRGDPQASEGADALTVHLAAHQTAIAASASASAVTWPKYTNNPTYYATTTPGSRYPTFYTYPPGPPGSYTSYPTPLPELPPAPLETVHEDMPILAHRAARLCVSRYGLRFQALNDSFGDFGVDADAQCMSASMTQISAPHRTPHVGCSCGFYALPADVPAPHELETVDLLVELSGTVIEHELGYRAEHQRVVECRLPRCAYCGKPVEVAWFVGGILTALGCERHYHGSIPSGGPLKGEPVRLTRADLEAGIPVPVSDEEIP